MRHVFKTNMSVHPIAAGLFTIALLLNTHRSTAQDSPIALIGAEIIPIAGPVIPKGTLVTHRGEIIAVGPDGSTRIPNDAQQIDGGGKVVMPGLICTHSHLGGGWAGDSSTPIQPDVRILDSINVRDAGLQKAQAGGLTTLNVMPGSGHLLSGQTIYIKLNDGKTIEDLAIRDDNGKILGGMKMANGTNSQRDPPFPGTRAKSAALVREQLIKAQAYREKLKKAEDDPDKTPDRDLAMEGLVEVLEGRRVVHFHTHRHDDIITILRLKKEFGFRVVLHHVSEGWKVVDEIAEANVPCSIILVDSPGGKIEAMNLLFHTGSVLEKAGVLTAFHTDDGITDSRLFFRMAALGVRAGMSREKALEALTIAGAKMLDLDQRIGSLEAGKDADFIVLSGDPFSVYTKVLETYVDGNKVFDRSDPKDRLYAVGGYGASHDQSNYLCCHEDEENH
ncbi:MAG: amidohydrolase family protein [Phycisphaerales bacterium]|nr:amidohydrolase family protein [Phycisphaerales bacterium]